MTIFRDKGTISIVLGVLGLTCSAKHGAYGFTVFYGKYAVTFLVGFSDNWLNERRYK